MSNVVIIGAGGVGTVAVHKCVEAGEVFSDLCLASRRLSRCEVVAGLVREHHGRSVDIEEVDASDTQALTDLLKRRKADIVIHVALPYQNLSIMDACLAAGAHYLDTANFEAPEEANFYYGPQWACHDHFRNAGLTALLGSGVDPGVTNVFCAYAQKHLFDRIDTIDIIDCNAGDHGYPFATNFNPEINIREITLPGKYYENGQWIQTGPLEHRKTIDFPGIGPRDAYLLYHEEEESLARHIPGVQRIRFWMTFSESYLTHLRVLQNVGMTRIDPVEFEGHNIVPIKFLQALLPDPAEIGRNYKGKTCIGCVIEGVKDGKPQRKLIYNNADHEIAYRETGAQAVSYTTGVPAMIGAKMIAEGHWRDPGVWNLEQLDPDPFMEDLNRFGLPWHVIDRDEPI